MRMRRVPAAAVAVAAVTVGGVAASVAPAQASSPVERPFKSTSVGTITNEPPPDCELVVLPGPEPTLVCDQSIDTVVIATHLGRSTSNATGVLTLFIARPCTTPDGQPGVEYASTTEQVIVAANGDELFATTSVTGCGDGVGLTEPAGTYSITGGTGRFEGATGEGSVSTSVVSSEGSFASSWTGTVTY